MMFSISVLLCKAFGRSGKHAKGNPLAPLAIEGPLWMLVSIPVAVGAELHKPEWFFPVMLLVIGGRYLTFNTIYGNHVFWLLGSTLVTSAFILVMLEAPVYLGGLAGGVIEFVFATVIYVLVRNQKLGVLRILGKAYCQPI